MDPEADDDLMWIARDGLLAPLQNPWIAYEDEHNEILYKNNQTGEITMICPLDNIYKELYKTEKAKKLQTIKQNAVEYQRFLKNSDLDIKKNREERDYKIKIEVSKK